MTTIKRARSAARAAESEAASSAKDCHANDRREHQAIAQLFAKIIAIQTDLKTRESRRVELARLEHLRAAVTL